MDTRNGAATHDYCDFSKWLQIASFVQAAVQTQGLLNILYGPLRQLSLITQGVKVCIRGRGFLLPRYLFANSFHSLTSIIMTRILFCLLLEAEVVSVVYHFLQASDPLPGLLLWAGDEVQVLTAALEHDGEAAALHLLLRALPQALRLTAHSHRWDVIEWNWRQETQVKFYTINLSFNKGIKCVMFCLKLLL